MSTTTTFSPKAPGEVIVVGMDFAKLVAAPINPSVSITWVDGVADAAPSAMLSGGASVAGAVVKQKLIGGVAGAAYRLLFQVDAADGTGQRFIEPALIRVADA